MQEAQTRAECDEDRCAGGVVEFGLIGDMGHVVAARSLHPKPTLMTRPNRDLPVCLAEHPHALLTPPALLMRLDLHKAIDWRNPCGEDGAYRRTTIRVPVEVRASVENSGGVGDGAMGDGD